MLYYCGSFLGFQKEKGQLTIRPDRYKIEGHATPDKDHQDDPRGGPSHRGVLTQKIDRQESMRSNSNYHCECVLARSQL